MMETFRLLGMMYVVRIFAAFARHTYRLDFRPMAALGLPILLLFFGSRRDHAQHGALRIAAQVRRVRDAAPGRASVGTIAQDA